MTEGKNKWIDEWMKGWINEWMKGYIKWMNEYEGMNEWMN